MPNWNPELYLKFEAERSRPANDLAARVASLFAGRKAPGSALDVGCGPGNSTAAIAAAYPLAALTGIDSSPDMIERARSSGIRAEWVFADAASWEPGRKFDLVFSNAAIQWVPDQAALIARMSSWLEPGGALAVQVPGNGDSPLHRALIEAAATFPDNGRFAGVEDLICYHEPAFFHRSLAAAGLEGDIWETTYWHRLPGKESLVEWYSGTGMRPWLEQLSGDAERALFRSRVLEIASPSYPDLPDGSVFFPFRRIFFTAVRR